MRLRGFPLKLPRGPFDISRSKLMLDVIHHNIRAELTAIDDYAHAVDLALTQGDVESFNLFAHIREEEREHLRELKGRAKSWIGGK